MMYPFMTLDDSAEIVHSEMRQDGTVKVYIEKPDEKDGFHHAECIGRGGDLRFDGGRKKPNDCLVERAYF